MEEKNETKEVEAKAETKKETKEVVKAEETKTEVKVEESKAEITTEEKPPVNSKQKSLFTKRNIIIGVIAIVLIIVGFIIIKGLFSKKFTDYPIAYVEDGQLILYNNASNSKIVVEEDFEDNDYLMAAYPHNNNDYFAYVDDGTLYLYSVKKANKEKISSGMEDGSIYFSPNDRYVIYMDDDNNIYSYDIKKGEKNKIIGGSSSVYTEIVENYLYITDGENDAIYVKDLNSDKEKEKIISDEVDSKRINEDGTKVLYTLRDNDESNTYSVYVYDIKKGEKTKILSSVITFETNDDFSEFIYRVKSSKEINLLEDDELNNDPVTTTTKTCTYSYYYKGYCTYRQYLYDEEFELSVSKKDINDDIREYAKKGITLYDVYYQKGTENSKLLVEGVTVVVSTNVTNKTVVYKKLPENIEKVKISTLQSLNDFKKYESTIKESVYYNVNGADEKEIISSDSEYSDVSTAYILDNNDIYINVDDNELYYYNKKDNKLVLLDEEFNYIYELEKDYLMYTSDYKDGEYTLKKAKGSETKEIISNLSKGAKYNDTVLLFSDCDDDGDSCTLYRLDDSKTVKLVDDVYYAVYLNDNSMYLFKNYSDSRDTVDIYSYRNGKVENVAFDIDTNYLVLPELY